jgi:SAM-dependent methyltransferase
MPNYLETVYFAEEYGKDEYPQKLCDYLYERYFEDYARAHAGEKLKLLDIGSGKGNHLVGFSRHNIEGYGIDKREECVEILDYFDIRECDMEKDSLPFEDNTFDFIFSKSVIEHVYNTDNFLDESYRVLKPGGIMVLMTPDWRSQKNYFWDDYTHVKPFTRKGFQNSLKLKNFKDVGCVKFYQLPFVWKYPWLSFVPKFISVIPDMFRFTDADEMRSRVWIRFSKEQMLLAKGVK